MAYGQGMATLTATDWIAAATARLGEGGVDAVRVEPLAQGLGVSKGSFYWHFDNRDALLRAVLAAWEERRTESVITLVEGDATDPRERVGRLLATVFGHPANDGVELGLRAWARHDPTAREVVTRVDARRVGYVTALLEAAGVPPRRAAVWAAVTYRTLIGEFALRSYGTDALSAATLQELVTTIAG